MFQRGTFSWQNAKTSVTSRSEGFGGNAYVPRAAYSFRMSFWTVPESFFHDVPRPFATARRKARRIDAVALIVMEIETFSSGISASSVSMSSSDATGTPTFPTSPRASTWSES